MLWAPYLEPIYSHPLYCPHPILWSQYIISLLNYCRCLLTGFPMSMLFSAEQLESLLKLKLHYFSLLLKIFQCLPISFRVRLYSGPYTRPSPLLTDLSSSDVLPLSHLAPASLATWLHSSVTISTPPQNFCPCSSLYLKCPSSYLPGISPLSPASCCSDAACSMKSS